MTGVSHRDIDAAEAGQRLDRWFQRHYPQVTHGRLQKLLRTGQIRVDGKRVKAGVRLEAGQAVRVPPLGDAPPAPKSTPRNDPADAAFVQALVLHRDADVIVIDKPAGLAVQGGSGTKRHLDGMLDALRFDAEERPRLVHRLDKDTSGVMVLARHAAAARALARTFRSQAARKVYWAVVVGVPELDKGMIDLPLAKGGRPGGERVSVDESDGKSARTLYSVVEAAGGRLAWLAFWPRTGRTHQLRAHAAAIGCPILGDGKYGGRDAFVDGLPEAARKLHLMARELDLPHPSGKGRIRATAPLPPHMAATWEMLGLDPALGEDDPFADVE